LLKKITYDDLILIFGEDFIPKELDKKILMKHFEVGSNRIIGERTIEKIKQVLENAIEATKLEQFRDKGGVISSPVARLHSNLSAKIDNEEKREDKEDYKPSVVEDKYGLNSIRKGLVKDRLTIKRPKNGSFIEDKAEDKSNSPDEKANSIEDNSNSQLPSVDELTVLSGGQIKRNGDDSCGSGYVQREISIRNYLAQDENASIRWGKEEVIDRKGNHQEINNPAYIFHSDLWQFEEARTTSRMNRCDILQYVTLDMVANNINVVMLENEEEPFFIVEGHGLLYSKDTLKDKIQIREPIHLMVITCEAWQIALKRPEALIKGQQFGKESGYNIDMTSVVPLADVQIKIAELDAKFKVSYADPTEVIKETIKQLEKHRKNIIWTCGAKVIDNLRQIMRENKTIVDNPNYELNMVIIGTKSVIHPIKIIYQPSGEVIFKELLPGYCSKHQILSESSIKNIFGSIPAIYDTEDTENWQNQISKITHAVHQRLGYSALENIFDPGYFKGSPSDTIPIGKIDIILPPETEKLQELFDNKGLIILY